MNYRSRRGYNGYGDPYMRGPYEDGPWARRGDFYEYGPRGPGRQFSPGGPRDYSINRFQGGRMQMIDNHMDETFRIAEQKPLPYPINALEPAIPPQEMGQLLGQHQEHVERLNALMRKTADYFEKIGDREAYLEFTEGVRYDGGGQLNYEFFWESLAP